MCPGILMLSLFFILVLVNEEVDREIEMVVVYRVHFLSRVLFIFY